MTVERVLANPEARSLLLASFAQERTAWELSERTGVPVARAYRLLHRLRLLKLVSVEGIHVTPRGRGKPLFRSRLRGLELFFRNGRLAVRYRSPSLSEPRGES